MLGEVTAIVLSKRHRLDHDMKDEILRLSDRIVLAQHLVFTTTVKDLHCANLKSDCLIYCEWTFV